MGHVEGGVEEELEVEVAHAQPRGKGRGPIPTQDPTRHVFTSSSSSASSSSSSSSSRARDEGGGSALGGVVGDAQPLEPLLRQKRPQHVRHCVRTIKKSAHLFILNILIKYIYIFYIDK